MPGAATRRTTARRSVDVFVECPKGSRTKYELDKATGRIRLDRVLYSSVHYPADYGFVTETMGGDGDPLDALIVVEEPTFPGCIVPARPIGTLLMRDSKGPDEKIVGVPVGDPRFDTVRELTDLAPHWLREIETFFSTYKTLEGEEVELKGWRGSRTAWSLITRSRSHA